MTTESLKDLADTVIGSLETFVSKGLRKFGERIEAIEKRLEDVRALKGDPGVDGKDGAPGRDGKDGAPGERGSDGEPGPQGEPGSPGRDGADSVVPGPPGERGVDGERGPQGLPGQPGAPGKDGSAGLNGKDGSDGLPGRDGRDGLDGKDGAPGLDALRIDPLDMIDESRSYPRGTYASHRGGLVRAVRTTDPIASSDGDLIKAGWHVLVEGFVDMGLEVSHDGREIAVGVVLTSGKVHAKTAPLQTMIYRGIWREGDFKRGDTVTRDGSVWHCEVTGTKQVPRIDGTDWKLIAKRGSDGRDGKDGAPGPRGPQGLPGVNGRTF